MLRQWYNQGPTQWGIGLMVGGWSFFALTNISTVIGALT